MGETRHTNGFIFEAPACYTCPRSVEGLGKTHTLAKRTWDIKNLHMFMFGKEKNNKYHSFHKEGFSSLFFSILKPDQQG